MSLGFTLLPFLGVALVVIVTPGPDTALTLRNTLMGGRRAGILTGLGVASGQSLWALATSFGLVALLTTSAVLFLILKYIGAAYLAFLGLQALRGACRRRGLVAPVDGAAVPRHFLRGAVAYRQGLLSNLANPKMLAFFASLLPQFAPPALPPLAAHMLLGATFAFMTAAWLTALAVLTAHAGTAFRHSLLSRVAHGLMGALLLGFAVRMATRQGV